MIQQEPRLRAFTLENPNIQINLQAPMTLQQFLREEDQSIMDKNFMEKYKKELLFYVFIFRIKYQNRQWQLRKRFGQFWQFANTIKKTFGKETPALPIHKQNELTATNIKHFADFFLIFLKRVAEIGLQDEDVRHFLEILPAKYGTGIIYAEVNLKKHSGGRYYQATCSRRFKNFFCGCCRNWRKRYFTITDECIFYTTDKKSYEIKQMLAFSSHSSFVYGVNQTGYDLGITVKSAYRTLDLKAEHLYQFIIFVWALKNALKNSSYAQINRFRSFAPIRKSCFSKYYIDGQNYFSDLCDELLKAKKSVFITGWMLTPYLLLKRPNQLDDRSCRLDYVLESIAQKGVKIYIIIYMEPKIALNNDSEYVQYYLQQLHKNIRVLRHPNYILVPFLWSHHEKMVVIDQKCAFMGGLDLCYGRWDTQKHFLLNYGNLWKGADFCNFRISDVYQPRNFLRSNLNPMSQPRMPWHDIAVQIRGESVIDLSRHFVQYWNFVSFQTEFNDRQLLIQAGRQSTLKQSTFWKNPFASFSPPQQKTMDIKQQLVNYEEVQEKEYYEHFLETDIKKFLQIPQINRITINKNLNQLISYPKKIINYIRQQQQELQQQRLMIPHETKIKEKMGEQSHQILRSASTWSLGLEAGFYQKSIYEAYQDLINNAKECIYIQNQFFICKKNAICQFLADRIIKAHKMEEKFKVIIMLPLLPGFEGDIVENSSAVMRVQLYWQYKTIARGKDSLLARLSSIPEPQNYIKILSLRTHDKIENSIPVTQILYIHSKLMIVDDSKVILGSANINDRSLLGDRDSQIAIIIEEDDLVQINGRKVSKSAHKLRCQLYRQHFNITLEEASDYHNQQIWQRITKKAAINTLIYRQVFGCYPDNTMKTYSDIHEMKKNSQLSKYEEESKKIDGFVVEWPMWFIEKENLNLKLSQKEYFVPEINFT